MSLAGLAVHIALLSLAIAILVPAGLTVIVLLIWEVVRTPETERETNHDQTYDH